MVNYPILIEYKGYKDKLVKLDVDGKVANKTAKNQPDFKNINSYAVNGAVHYANALLHYTSYTDIIAIGMTGYKNDAGKLEYEIGVSKSNFGVGQKVDDFTDLSFLKKSNFDAFIEKVKQLQLSQEEIEKLREHREQEINASLVKLNNDIYNNEKGLSERDRVYLVAASIIATLGVPGKVAALEKSELKSSTEEGNRDGDIILRKIKAAEKGLTVAQVYMQIAAALQSSASVSDVTLDSEDMDLTVDAAEGSVLKRENLLELELSAESSASSAMTGSTSGSGAMGQLTGDSEEDKTFKLGDVATVTETVSMNTISRDQQRRCVTVTAAIADGYNVTHVTSAAQQAVSGLTLPEGVTAEFNGENEQIMEAMSQLLLMLLLGVVLVYFIMVAQFQSLKSPFIVMFTIPLAFTGGFLALLIAGIEVSVISLIGFVMLVGIIVNNGIVLVDYINQQRLSGMERREAIIDAGVTRLRPILMTSLTTILGLIVTATAKNAGTALMQPIAVVCIGGLLYATLMTLFVVPCMYDMMNKKDMHKVDESELQIVDM